MNNNEALGKVDELLNVFIDVSEIAVQKIYDGQTDKSVELISEMLDAIVNDILIRQVFQTELGEIIQVFDEISTALEKKDYVLMGDLLEYELLPLFKSWKGKIPLIQ